MSKSSTDNSVQSIEVENQYAGERLDKVLASYFPSLSRSRLQDWIKNGQVKVNELVALKPKQKLLGGEWLEVETTLEDQGEWIARDIPLDIHYADESLIVINKPSGLVVHPAPGHYEDTLVNGLLMRFPELRKLPRAGVVHRLDRDTTGLLVVARTAEAHHSLVAQLQDRAFDREYVALVHGELVAGDTLDYPIGRHPTNRKKMAVTRDGKEAITHFRVAEKFKDFTLLRVKLETGRTHQIRVHFSYLKHPLVGDPVYCVRNLQPKRMSETHQAIFLGFQRQALHARLLGLTHPESGEWMQWECDLPEDLCVLLQTIRDHEAANQERECD